MRAFNRERASLLCLMAATFFFPLGYDILFKTLYDWLGSYWHTVFIFYCLSAFFFTLFFFLSRKKSLTSGSHQSVISSLEICSIPPQEIELMGLASPQLNHEN